MVQNLICQNKYDVLADELHGDSGGMVLRYHEVSYAPMMVTLIARTFELTG